jgi:phage terminase large subunit
MKFTYKQTAALDYLEDKITEEVLFGGSAGPGKSALGCYWQLKNRLKYPGSRGFIGRDVFKTLKDTTLKTLFEIAGKQGLKRGKHYDLTGAHDKENPNCVMFDNSSLIYLRDLKESPSDPDFDELGSLEITDCFIDECSQIVQKAKDILRTRLRFKLIEFDLIPKALYATNPNKGWSYYEFYKPSKDGILRPDRQFVKSLATDNPYISPAYLDSLRKLPEGPTKQRLYFGNWEYSDDPAALILYEKILDCFTNNFDSLRGKRYITVDVARFGSDKTVIGVWDGFRVKLFMFKKLSVPEVAEKVQYYQQLYNVPNSNTIVDEDGVGGGVVDIVKCNGFVNNSRPLPNPIKPQKDEKGNVKPENYDNLKSQCSYRAADRVNSSGLYIEDADAQTKEAVVEEMEQVKQKDVDSDGKKAVMPKDLVKEGLGRSPDYWDAIMMREWFELKPIVKAGAIML